MFYPDLHLLKFSLSNSDRNRLSLSSFTRSPDTFLSVQTRTMAERTSVPARTRRSLRSRGHTDRVIEHPQRRFPNSLAEIRSREKSPRCGLSVDTPSTKTRPSNLFASPWARGETGAGRTSEKGRKRTSRSLHSRKKTSLFAVFS